MFRNVLAAIFSYKIVFHPMHGEAQYAHWEGGGGGVGGGIGRLCVVFRCPEPKAAKARPISISMFSKLQVIQINESPGTGVITTKILLQIFCRSRCIAAHIWANFSSLFSSHPFVWPSSLCPLLLLLPLLPPHFPLLLLSLRPRL